jgi:WD40 repeat protein
LTQTESNPIRFEPPPQLDQIDPREISSVLRQFDLAAVSPDGSWCAVSVLSSGSAFEFSTQIQLYDTATWKVYRQWPAHDGIVSAMLFSADQELVTRGSDEAIRFWDPETGKQRFELEALEGPSSKLAISSNASLLVEVAVGEVGDVGQGRVWRADNPR